MKVEQCQKWGFSPIALILHGKLEKLQLLKPAFQKMKGLRPDYGI